MSNKKHMITIFMIEMIIINHDNNIPIKLQLKYNILDMLCHNSIVVKVLLEEFCRVRS